MARHFRDAARHLTKTFLVHFDKLMREVIERCFQECGADEGTIWLLDEKSEYLIPVFNSGPDSEEFVGKFKQSLSSGMISMVVATEQPICENEVHRNQRQDRTLDGKLGVQTQAMIATPLYFGGELRGVISAVLLNRPSESPHSASSVGFRWEQLQKLQRTAALFARLIEHKILTALIEQPRGT